MILGEALAFVGLISYDANVAPWQQLLGTIANGSLPSAAETVLTLSTPILLPAGEYQLILNQDAGVSGSILLYANANRSQHIDSVKFVAGLGDVGTAYLASTAYSYTAVACNDIQLSQEEDVGISPWLCLLTAPFGGTSNTTPQADAPINSGDLLRLDNIILTADDATPRTPLIVLPAEEASTFYLHQWVLKNTTTGQNITVYFPGTLSSSLVLDLDAKTLTDSETGLQIPFALTASDPEELMYFAPGNNVLEFDETGVVSMTVAASWRGRYN